MEIKTSNVQVESNEQLQSKQFTVEANANAFEILTGTLYRNVQTSIVRELISNGHDGHVRNGNTDKPMFVHSPSPFEPTFEVRDFGCSMDEQTMMNVYTTFFSSTKNNTNAEVGGFGLGCKLPFAYTDMFTITTYLNGKKQDYLACKEKGVPALNKIGDAEPTDEPNGVKVVVPVLEDDCVSFEQEIERLAKYSDFIFESNIDLPVKPVEKDNLNIKGFHNFGARQDREKPGIVRIGGVPYLLDIEELTGGMTGYTDCGDIKHSNIDSLSSSGKIIREIIDNITDDFSKSCLNCMYPTRMCSFNGMLDFNVGELDVTASRESLQYTQRTKKSLWEKLIELNLKIHKHRDQVVTKWNNHIGSPQEFLTTLTYLRQFNWCGNRYYNDRLTYKLGNFKDDLNIGTDKPSFVVWDEKFIADNKILQLLDHAKAHKVNSRSRWSHKPDYIHFDADDIGNKKLKIYITNAPLQSCGLDVFTEEEKTAYGNYGNKQIITVKSNCDFPAQVETLKNILEECCPGLYEVVPVDKKDLFIPSQAKSYKASKVDENGDKPMTAMARKIIEEMKPIQDYFGCLYLYKGKEFPLYHRDLLDALSRNHELLGIPDIGLITRQMEVHGTARAMVEKIAECPVFYLDEYKDFETNPLFQRLLKKIQLLAVRADLPYQLVDFMATCGVKCEAGEKLAKFNNLSCVFYHDAGVSTTKVEDAAKNIVLHFLKGLPTIQQYKVIAQAYMNRRQYGLKRFLKEYFDSLGLQANDDY